MVKKQMINSRDINELVPEAQDKCRQFIQLCKSNNIDVIITSTYRDDESQNALYAQGRTAPGKLVTNAKAGQSFHNFRVAFDFVPLINGKPQWANISLIDKCGQLGKQCGLEWAGDWNRFKEKLHLQLPNLTLQQLKNNLRNL